MIGFKWASILTAVLTAALDALANLLLATLTTHSVPEVVNLFAVACATVAAVVAIVSHAYGRVEAKIDLIIELVVGRFDELETRIGDRNSGFVEGYMLSRGPEASVVPLAPRGVRRAAGSQDD
ncbi:hypothetical protein GCM10023322_23840 [Rugosimonospora acidiphila]|uniref:Holin n=1 Tax=Rugosimonospora acidiphila TaxID=556531 RepID=A0ABP9RPR2_9ACTN